MKNFQNFTILEYDEVVSTNSVATSLSSENFRDRVVVLARKQTGGRGQAGNSWESEPYKNISLSVIFKPEKLESSRQFVLSMMISLACIAVIRKYTGDVAIKWPNDIYVGDRKIGGILIENSVAGKYLFSSVCGIGLNINQAKFCSDAPNPVSLYQLTGNMYEIDDVVKDLLYEIDLRYSSLNAEALKEEYLQELYRKEGSYIWRDDTGEFRASLIGIDEYGQLILQKENGHRQIYGFKEISYII